MEQTEYIKSQGQHIGIKNILDYIEENWPRGYRIPYKFILVPVLILFLFMFGASFIRSPYDIYPPPGSAISETPIFRFKIVKNLFYIGYEANLRYLGGGDIQHSVVEKEGGEVSVFTPVNFARGSEVVLTIKVKKGVMNFTIWDKLFKYQYKVGG